MCLRKVVFCLFLLFDVCESTSQTTIGLIEHDAGTLDDGYVLFAPISSTTTYLIDRCGKQKKIWESTYKPGQSCYLLSDGTLIRTGNINNSTFNAGGKGGKIEKFDWSGNVTWSYTISSALECQHHDIKTLSNGNVLAIVWESKTNAEAITQGRNPSLTTTTVWSEKIIEIQPTGTTGGNIVWEWHLWDHMIQDFDNTKMNFGVIASNPQLLNINFNASSNPTLGKDWIHLNSIDYNATLDQILVSSHSFNEIWVIDHSTTTVEAASHSGGNSGKGGDLIYRWGNPSAYSNGGASEQKLFGQHNAHWIENGLPYQNEIMIFNNGNGRIGGNYSTVEIISPPVSGYNYTSTLPYLPASTSWTYNAGNSANFYAQNISGAQQLSNGNVLICDGPSGTFSEIDSLGTTLWKYVNPVTNTGIANQGASATQNLVFRCSFYPFNFSGFLGQTFFEGSTVENSNSISNSCSLTTTIEENLNENTVAIYPNPASDVVMVQVNTLLKEDAHVVLYDLSGKILQEATLFQGSTIAYLDTRTLYNGEYIVLITSNSGKLSEKIIINK